MASRMTRWLTRIQQQRRILLLLGLLSSGGSWLLPWPSAPVMTLPVTYVKLLTWVAPHTLVLTREDRTELYPDLRGTPSTVVQHGSVLHPLGGNVPPTAVSADGRWLLVATVTEHPRTYTMTFWSVEAQQIVLSIPVEVRDSYQYFQRIALRSNGQLFGWIISGEKRRFEHSIVRDRGIHPMVMERTFTGNQAQEFATELLDLDGAEPLLLRSSADLFEVRQLRDDQLRYQQPRLSFEGAGFNSTSISQDRQWIAHGGQGLSTIRRFSDGQLLYRFRERDSAYHSWDTSVALSPDKRYLLSGSVYTGSGGGLFVGAPDFRWPMVEHGHLIDIATGQVVQRFQGGDGGVSMVAYSPDGQYVAMRAGEEVRVFRVQPQPPYLQVMLALLGLLLLLLALGLWVWARR